MPVPLSPSKPFAIGDPARRGYNSALEPIGLPKQHPLGVVGNDEGGDMQVGSEVSQERVVSNDKS